MTIKMKLIPTATKQKSENDTDYFITKVRSWKTKGLKSTLDFALIKAFANKYQSHIIKFVKKM